MAWYNKPKQRKTFKKGISKELMSIAWHPDGGIGACQVTRKKEIDTIFTDKIGKWQK